MNNKKYQYYNISIPQNNVKMARVLFPQKETEQNQLDFYFLVKENADEVILEKAFNRLIYENDAMRTRFVDKWFGLWTYQYFYDYEYEKLEIISVKDWNACQEKMQEYQHQIKIGTRNHAKQYWAAIITFDEGAVLFIKVAHNCFDGYSMGLAINKLAEYYSAYENNEALDEPNQSYTIRDYLYDSNDYYHSKKFKNNKKYWKQEIKKLKDIEFPFPNEKSYTGIKSNEFIIDDKTYKALSALGKSTNLPVSFLIFSAIGYTIYDLTGCKRFVIAVPTHGRVKIQEKDIIGCIFYMFLHFFDIDTGIKRIEYIERNYMEFLNNMTHSKLPIWRFFQPTLKKAKLNKYYNCFNLMISTYDARIIDIDENKYGFGDVHNKDSIIGHMYISIIDSFEDTVNMSMSYQDNLFTDNSIANAKEIFMDNINKILEEGL